MITVVGEALVDIVVAADRTTTEHVGGSPANVAVALARLGNRVALVTEFGTDARGDRIGRFLGDNGVTVLGEPRTQRPTSTARATLDAAGVATYDFDLAWTLESAATLDLRADCSCLHTGSLAAALDPGAAAVTAAMRAFAGRGIVSFDPNIRSRLEPGGPAAAAARTRRVASLAHIVKASEEDLDWLFPHRSIEDVASELLAAGPITTLVVVTRGGDGAQAQTAAGQRAEVGAWPALLVDTVGAGDAFTAGLLDALARRNLLDLSSVTALAAQGATELEAILTEASIVAALTCERPGADPPTRERVRQDDRYARYF